HQQADAPHEVVQVQPALRLDAPRPPAEFRAADHPRAPADEQEGEQERAEQDEARALTAVVEKVLGDLEVQFHVAWTVAALAAAIRAVATRAVDRRSGLGRRPPEQAV